MTLVLTLIVALHVTFVSAFGGSGEVATCVKSRFMPRPTIGRRSIFGVKKITIGRRSILLEWKNSYRTKVNFCGGKGNGLGRIQTICWQLQIATKTVKIGKVLTCVDLEPVRSHRGFCIDAGPEPWNYYICDSLEGGNKGTLVKRMQNFNISLWQWRAMKKRTKKLVLVLKNPPVPEVAVCADLKNFR